MRLIIILILGLMLWSVEAQRLQTYFLPPSVPYYTLRESYYFGVISNRANLCQSNWLCQTDNMLVEEGLEAFKRCGMHNFVSYKPGYSYNVNLGTMTYDMSLSVYVNPIASPEMIKCLSYYQPEMCLSPYDIIGMNCLLFNTTFKAPYQPCIPEWAFITLIVGITILFLIGYIIYRIRHKRIKTYYLQHVDDLKIPGGHGLPDDDELFD